MRNPRDDRDLDAEKAPFRLTRPIIAGIIASIYFVVSTVLAQSITIGGGNKIEFGQGMYTVAACDSFIGIQLTPTSATYSGTRADGVTPYSGQSRVKNIQFYGLDTIACAGKSLKIKLLPSGSVTPLDLFTDANSLAVNRALVSVDVSTSTPRSTALTIVNGIGLNIGRYDAYEYLTFTSTTGVYTLIFTYPLALMADVTAVTLESTTTA